MKPFLISLALVLSSCVTASNVPSEIAGQIPRGASAIVLHDACYADVYRAIAASGYSFAQENADMGTFGTAPKDIGQGTTLSVSAFSDGCTTTLRGVWGLTQSMAAGLSGGSGISVAGGAGDAATWSSGRPKAAFGELAIIASALKHSRIEYLE